MKRTPHFLSIILLVTIFSISFLSQVHAEKLHGKALKEKEASIEIIRGVPDRLYKKLGPLWASKGSMKSTMKNLRKQAAKMGADAVIDVRVKTEKLQSAAYDPGFWGGPGYWGPWGGPWGGFGYWGGYVSAHTYVQPVVLGWAVQWTGEGLGEAPVPAPAETAR